GGVAEIVETLEPELRSLGDHLVLGSALGIGPERRRGLKAPRQRDQQVAGNRLFGEPDELRLASIDVDVELGVVGRLLDMQIDGAGDAAQFLKELVGEL